MKDGDIMPFGKYKGRAMIDVPDDYLKWFWKENYGLYKRGRTFYNQKAVMKYIEESFNESELNNGLL